MQSPELLSFLDVIPDGIVVVDAAGMVTLCNQAAINMTGSPLLTLPISEVIPGSSIPSVLGGTDAEPNMTIVLNGAESLESCVPLHDGDGNLIGAVSVFKDISALKGLAGSASDLWRARDIMEAVVESMDDAVSVADRDGRNLLVNQAYTRLTGLPREEVIGKSVTVDIAEGESMHMKVLKTGTPVRNVRMSVGPTKRDVVVNVVPITVEGEIRGSVGVIHDISAMMKLTEELMRTKTLLRHLGAKYSWDDIIGENPGITSAKEHAARAAATSATVLLRGESGTGKELFAHAIHHASDRSERQFVRVNCTAIAEGLLESELFGYTEGAFTGAIKGGKKGYFEEGNGGTIFLDEVGELGLNIQSKLLRVLQEREIVRVGSSDTIEVNVRVIAATNADLEKKVKDGTFREDLYYRLNVIPIHIIPLRQRKDDIPLIAAHLLPRMNQEYHREVGSITDSALRMLSLYNWPGNIRELWNVLGRAMLNMSAKDTAIQEIHMPSLAGVSAPGGERAQTSGPLHLALERAEKTAIIATLTETGGNRQKTAAILDISLRSLYYKINKYGL
jgi:PAS domain S-box-containing protein